MVRIEKKKEEKNALPLLNSSTTVHYNKFHNVEMRLFPPKSQQWAGQLCV